MQRDYDVIVLGGGSAGLQSARSILEKAGGFSVLVIEEDRRVGFPEHCTGLVSLKGVSTFLRLNHWQIAVNYVRGAHIMSPSGTRVTVEKKSSVAAVINRPLYEQKLYDIVSRRADILLGVKATTDGRSVKAGSKRLVARYIVDARGLKSLSSRHPQARRWILPALQYDVRVESTDSEYVYIFLGSKFSQGFFAWAVPLGDDVFRIGLASENLVLTRMKYLLRRMGELTRGSLRPKDVRKVIGGAVYTGGLREHVKGTVLYVGDSAGQTKPTTGGGLVYHSRASILLAKALERGEPEAYARDVKRTLGLEILGQLALRRIFNRMSDSELDYMLASIKEIEGEEIISTYGDMDTQTKVILRVGMELLRKKPLFYTRLLLSIVSSIIS
ncbi:NAD(P)/FAD-dependent oxidoreductase [Infirmifilum lucidum]|uniref:NAD(P)/FAD-dependent oxidoreductase n=1 Tax=Infirmifilum lucidum TaxID=2776706 RepID=A0A7L9FIS7_9CREN|nr:NAD(P)/FAD-dependent oxidoreductase [Infirmifilum lucidum]QOJ79541.1 NAD(P)/FAD-dependent oxidoreductase [Infirmifilum lucidum]